MSVGGELQEEMKKQGCREDGWTSIVLDGEEGKCKAEKKEGAVHPQTEKGSTKKWKNESKVLKKS